MMSSVTGRVGETFTFHFANVRDLQNLPLLINILDEKSLLNFLASRCDFK